MSGDTDYVEGSVTNNTTIGEYSFIAKLATYGKNTVRFRTTMAGKADSVIGFDIDYRPSRAKYTLGKVWAMDYPILVARYIDPKTE